MTENWINVVPELSVVGDTFNFDKAKRGEMFGVLQIVENPLTTVTISFQENEMFKTVRTLNSGLGGEQNLSPMEAYQVLSGFDSENLITNADELAEFLQFRDNVAALLLPDFE